MHKLPLSVSPVARLEGGHHEREAEEHALHRNQLRPLRAIHDFTQQRLVLLRRLQTIPAGEEFSTRYESATRSIHKRITTITISSSGSGNFIGCALGRRSRSAHDGRGQFPSFRWPSLYFFIIGGGGLPHRRHLGHLVCRRCCCAESTESCTGPPRSVSRLHLRRWTCRWTRVATLEPSLERA